MSIAEIELKSVTKKTTKLGLALLLSLLMPLFAHAQQDLKIGFVSLDKILKDSTPAKAATARLEQEFSKREKDLQELSVKLKSSAEKLDKDAPIISDAERSKRQRELGEMDKDFQRRQREFREDLNQRRNEEMAAVLDRASKVVKQMAETEKYDLVLQEAVYVGPRIDITEKVLKALNK